MSQLYIESFVTEVPKAVLKAERRYPQATVEHRDYVHQYAAALLIKGFCGTMEGALFSARQDIKNGQTHPWDVSELYVMTNPYWKKFRYVIKGRFYSGPFGHSYNVNKPIMW